MFRADTLSALFISGSVLFLLCIIEFVVWISSIGSNVVFKYKALIVYYMATSNVAESNKVTIKHGKK